AGAPEGEPEVPPAGDPGVDLITRESDRRTRRSVRAAVGARPSCAARSVIELARARRERAAAEGESASSGGLSEARLQRRILREPTERFRRAGYVGGHEAFDAVGQEIADARYRKSDDGKTARHRLQDRALALLRSGGGE